MWQCLLRAKLLQCLQRVTMVLCPTEMTCINTMSGQVGRADPTLAQPEPTNYWEKMLWLNPPKTPPPPPSHTVDLVIFARFQFSQIPRRGQIREFKYFAKIIIIIALLSKNENSRILNFVRSPKIKNSRKFKHAKVTISTVYGIWKIRTSSLCWIITEMHNI